MGDGRAGKDGDAEMDLDDLKRWLKRMGGASEEGDTDEK